MPPTHFEPFLHLVDVTHDRALIAWGGFFFERTGPDEQWRIVDDRRLDELDPGRVNSIGTRSQPYGDALVEVYDESGVVVARARTGERNHVWIHDLEPDTTYSYRVLVDGEPWAEGERFDWGPVSRGGLDLAARGRRYRRTFRTHPSPSEHADLSFAVIGDFGVGATADTESGRRQRRIAAVLDRLVEDRGVRLVLTTGDNVYLTTPGRAEQHNGNQDDDWHDSFYSPYRYLISQVPVYPTVGNHDTAEADHSDDRSELAANFHIESRFADTDEEDRATLDPGLNYRLGFGADVEFISIDTTETPGGARGDHYFEYAEHAGFLEHAFPSTPGARWRIPFFHHPPYSAGPHHTNNPAVLEHLLPLFRRAGVEVTFAGHEHNFQLSRADGMTHVVTGAGGKLQEQPPQDFAAAHTEAWAVQAHCLLVEITGEQMRITPVSGLGADGEPELMSSLDPNAVMILPPFQVTAEASAQPRRRVPC